MKSWAYSIEHWHDIFVFMSAVRPSLPWKDMAIVLLVPVLSIYASVLVNENKAANAEKDIDILRTRIETNTRILESDRATVEMLVRRSDQLEQRHDAIMAILMNSARSGSGYTWLPGEKKN